MPKLCLVNNSINALTYLPQTLLTYLSWAAEDTKDLGVTGSKVKVTGVKCVKTVSDCLSNNFPKWISSSYIYGTYFELTYNPVLQNICDKNVLQTSLVYISLGTQLVLSSSLSSYAFTLQCSSQSELISNKTCDQTAWKLHCYPYYLVVLFLQKQLNNKGFTLKQVVIYILSVYTMYVITRCSTRFVVQLYRGPFYWVCCFVELRFMYQTPKPMYISYARHPSPLCQP